MAKISTYPGPSSPSLSDMLIGTDVNDMNMTKNFTISDIISLVNLGIYVPYTGATGDVDLNNFNITANSFIVLGGSSNQFLKADGSTDSNVVPYTGGNNDVFLLGYGFYANEFVVYGGSSSEFLKADGSIDSNAYALASSIIGLVPYTGATGNVDLGANRLTADAILARASTGILYLSPSPFDFVGAKFDFPSSVYSFGDYTSINNGTYIKIDDANTRIELSKGIYTNGSVGTSGQILTSQGAGLPPTWTTSSYLVPKYGSFYDTTTQTTIGNETLPMKLNTTDVAATSGFSIVNDTLGRPTRITSTVSGVYNVQFSAQLHKTSGGGATQIYIWFRRNGLDLTDSATTLTLANNGDLLVAAWNYFVNLTAGQYVEIMWRASAANIEIQRNTTVPSVPGIPSVIATINRVS